MKWKKISVGITGKGDLRMKKKTLWVFLFISIGLLSTGCSPRIKELLDRQCMIKKCKEKVYEEGLCQEHYQAIYETEEIEKAEEIEETETIEETGALTEHEVLDKAMTQGQEPQMTGVETTAETTTAITTEEPVKSQNGQTNGFEDEISYIRDTYTYANTYYTYSDYEHSLRQKNGYDGDDGVRFPDGFSYYDIDGNLIKIEREHSFNGIRVESYYVNPALGREVPKVRYLDTFVVFAFATDANGGEYRFYFSNGNVIRYIGPDGQVVDYPFPDGLNWRDFSIESASLSGGEQISSILLLLSPMWYIPYEGCD